MRRGVPMPVIIGTASGSGRVCWVIASNISLIMAGVVQKARYFSVDTHQQSLYATGSGAVPTTLTRFGYTTDEGLHSINVDNQLTRRFTAAGVNIICWLDSIIST